MKLLIVPALLLCLLLLPHPASAHVLLTDKSNTIGSILHIVPDDDPVAGEPAVMYFEVAGLASLVQLNIENESGQNELINIPFETDTSIASIDYNFPSQGIYKLSFKVVIGEILYEFKHSQRVSRGSTTSPLDKQSHAWAEMLLIASVIGGLLLIIVIYNRRHNIAKQSSF